MLTREIGGAYQDLPVQDKAALLALSVLIERISSLPRADRDDLFELLQEWRKAESREAEQSIHRAMEEILGQRPVRVKQFPLEQNGIQSRKLQVWADHVGGKVKFYRESAGLTQVQLAEKAGLPQSHISRLENAEHSATNMTLEKIANALGIPVGDLDPIVD